MRAAWVSELVDSAVVPSSSTACKCAVKPQVRFHFVKIRGRDCKSLLQKLSELMKISVAGKTNAIVSDLSVEIEIPVDE